MLIFSMVMPVQGVLALQLRVTAVLVVVVPLAPM